MSRLAVPANPYSEAVSMTEKQFAFYNALAAQLTELGRNTEPMPAWFRRFTTKRNASDLIQMRAEALAWVKANPDQA
jgi:hypothetical protein